MANVNQPLLSVLSGQRTTPPPLWMMRQAGRYLPEYRALRKQAGSFLDLCFTPRLAAAVTLQPIERFDFDAAIVFSDILVIPHALGQKLWFEEGAGPRLEPLAEKDIPTLDRENVTARLDAVMETLERVRAQLPSHKSLVGFCGAPWTVATYMIAGQGTSDQMPARQFAQVNPAGFSALIDCLVEASIDYLVGQFNAGADAVQIFDTWAGILAGEEFERWCVAPTARIVAGVRQHIANAPIIGFPRGAGRRVVDYVERTGVSGVGLDWIIDRQWVAQTMPGPIALQGNLDPATLVAGGQVLRRSVAAIGDDFADRAHIFNLGHGIVPQTPIAHVEALVRYVREIGS